MISLPTGKWTGSHVQVPLMAVAGVPGDGSVVGGSHGTGGPDGGDDGIHRVAAGVPHHQPAGWIPDLHLLVEPGQDDVAGEPPFAGQWSAGRLLVVLVRQAEPLEDRAGTALDEDSPGTGELAVLEGEDARPAR